MEEAEEPARRGEGPAARAGSPESTKLQLLGQLTLGVVHDFHNLLTVIRTSTDVMGDELPAGHPLQLDLSWIRGAVERGSALTGQLLAFARRDELPSERLELNQIIRDLLRMLSRLLGSRVTVRTRLDPGGAVIDGNRSQLEQVLLNLVLNARDAMPAGGTLTIGTARLPERSWPEGAECRVAGPLVRVWIEDSGEGLGSVTREQILTPFFTTKPEGEGSGLGLAIVQAAVTRLSGCLEVATRIEPGARFELYFPDGERRVSGR